jgi:hypothetical protein
MGNKNGTEGGSLQDLLNSGEPITHFFYEYRGERAVEPLLLIENGITLWHEHIYSNEAHDNSYLWGLAASIVEDRGDTPMYSWVGGCDTGSPQARLSLHSGVTSDPTRTKDC